MTRDGDPRAEILEAAAREIAMSGFHGMSMRDLAKATGRGLSSFYTYFRSKEDLLYALHVEAFEALIAGAEDALSGAHDPAVRLHAFVLAHVRYFKTHRDLMRVLVREGGCVPADRRDAVRREKERYFAIARDLVAALMTASTSDVVRARVRIDPAELDRATYALFGMMNWMHAWYDADAHGEAEDVARTIARIAVEGLAGGVGERAPRRAAGRAP